MKYSVILLVLACLTACETQACIEYHAHVNDLPRSFTFQRAYRTVEYENERPWLVEYDKECHWTTVLIGKVFTRRKQCSRVNIVAEPISLTETGEHLYRKCVE